MNSQKEKKQCKDRTFQSNIDLPFCSDSSSMFFDFKTKQHIFSDFINNNIWFVSDNTKNINKSPWRVNGKFHKKNFYPRQLCVQPHTDNLLVYERSSSSISVLTNNSFNPTPNSDQFVIDYASINVPGPTHVSALCCDEKGNIIAGCYNNMNIFDASGRPITKSKPTDANTYGSITDLCLLSPQFSQTSSVFLVCDSLTKELTMENSDRSLCRVIYTTNSIADMHVVTDLNGMIYVNYRDGDGHDDSNYTKIDMLDPRMDFKSIQKFDTTGYYFNFNDMSVDDKNVLVLSFKLHESPNSFVNILLYD